MDELSDRQTAEYFHRSYKTVDGLWFMKVEERYGFETALDIDEDVWMVLPKIQARMMKSFLQKERGPDDLFDCLTTRLRLEGFEFTWEREQDGFLLRVSRCPWHDLMVKAGRETLNEQVGTRICEVENRVWAEEFGEDIRFSRRDRICKGSASCLLEFRKTEGNGA